MPHEYKKCSIDGCDGDASAYKKGARGWCGAHYSRWRRHGDPLSGYAPRWEATKWLNDVAVRYEGDECLIWPFRTNIHGRPVVGNEGRVKLTSRLVCELVHGPPPSKKYHAAHSCGNGHIGCVNPHHLRWATPKENSADMIDHGTRRWGERHRQSKLRATQVREIRRRCSKGESHANLAREFGVVNSAIWNIVNFKRWANLR